jgi:hypothetical protein
LAAQVGEAAFERGDTGLESLRVEVALLEGAVVAVESSLAAADLLS